MWNLWHAHVRTRVCTTRVCVWVGALARPTLTAPPHPAHLPLLGIQKNSNLYFTELTTNKWSKKKWDGPLQYEDKSKALMMLPTDMASNALAAGLPCDAARC